MRAMSRREWPWGGILACAFLLQSPFACENVEQSAVARAGGSPDGGSGLGAHDQPPLRLSALPQRARERGRPHHLLAVARRTVSPQRRADPEGPRVLRRVRR